MPQMQKAQGPGMTNQTLQDWYGHQKGRFAAPDFINREVRDTGVFVRTLGKRCPTCRDVFFTYQREGTEGEPYRVDPDPPDGRGTRDTCGHPRCWEAEDDRQFQRRLDARRKAEANRKAELKAAAKPKPQAGPVLL